ncbi:MAG: DUF1573 domain-containing protein, partial [Calditrichaeota bacterium]|nr:DUF1573 domain-containing protein [Calditrichota bacterium]
MLRKCSLSLLLCLLLFTPLFAEEASTAGEVTGTTGVGSNELISADPASSNAQAVENGRWSGPGRDQPTIEVQPNAIEIEMFTGDMDEVPITIGNTGDEVLEFTVGVEVVGEPERAPRRDNRSDPDDMGWEWRDNLEDDGPEFEWVDVRELDGVRAFNMGDDQNTGALQLGWTYTFWGREFQTIYANTDAWASFTYTGNGYNITPAGYPLAANGNVRNANFINFMQVDHTQGTDVWFWSNGEDLARIMWAGNHSTWFELALHGNGMAVMQYGENVAARACGVNLGDGEHGWYFGNQIANGRAIAFGPAGAWVSWIAVDQEAGEIGPDEELDIFAIFDATGLIGGDYAAEITINSNDPDNDAVVVDVALTVTGAPSILVEWGEDFGFPDVMDWNMLHPEVFSGGPYDFDFVVTNEGTDLLIISDLFIEQAAFSIPFDADVEIEPGEATVLTVTFDSEEAGEYDGELVIVWNDPNEEDVVIALHAQSFASPEIIVDPQAIEDELLVGAELEASVLIANSGEADLNWTTNWEVLGVPGQDINQRGVRSTDDSAGPRRDDFGDVLGQYVWNNAPVNRYKNCAYDIENEIMWLATY